VRRIDSSANPRYKALRRLVESSRERARSGRSVLDGAHLVAAYLDHAGQPEEIAVSRQGSQEPEVRALLERMPRADVLVLGDALFAALSSVVTPTGILAVVTTPRPELRTGEIDACVMLEELQDPGNLGSILRSCAAAGIGDVLLSRGSVHAWSPRVLRAGMGAHFALSIHEGMDLAAAARDFGGILVATRAEAKQSVFETDLRGRVALLFGNEGAGLSSGLLQSADRVVSVPMPGKAESLNIAAAAAVCLFERVRQRSVAGLPRPRGANRPDSGPKSPG
jgi:TrmH family RNA methyltransferase